MSGISYGLAFFLGTFLQCTMYGIFVSLWIGACYVQWIKFSRGRGVNRVMVFATVFFWFTITIHCALSLVRVIQTGPLGLSGLTVYQTLNPPYDVVEIVWWGVFELQIVVADIIMVYRMYHIYERNPFVCVVPSITIAGLFAVGCGLTNQHRNLATAADKTALDNWSSACFCLTLFNSLFTTVMISVRLWCVHRETAKVGIQVGGSVILRAMKVLIESAALWTTFVSINFFTFLAKSNLTYTLVAMVSPAVGISFCLIIVRLGLPEFRDESLHVPVRTGPLEPRTSQTPDLITISFARVRVLQDEYTSSESKGPPMETLDSQKQRCIVTSSDDLPKINFPTPTP